MRHRQSGRKLNRTSSHRHAMFRNMACSLFRYEQIRTTLPKAKELRRVAEPLITLGKTASLANRRLAYARLRDREMVGKLFDDLGIRFKARPGGYLRILKSGFRAGDNAPLAIVQLVDRPQPAAPEKKADKKADKTPAAAAPRAEADEKAKEKPKKEKKAATATKAAKKAPKETKKKATAKKATKKKSK